MELKWKKDLREEEISGLAEAALVQFVGMRCNAEMKEDGIDEIQVRTNLK